jgi:signal transduction histidine kinase
MRWTWRAYVALAFMLATGLAFMNVVGSMLKFDAPTFWRVYFALWLGQFAGYAAGFAGIAAALTLDGRRRVAALVGAVVAGTAIGLPVWRLVVGIVGAEEGRHYLDWISDAAAMASLLGVIAVAMELQLRRAQAESALHAQSLREPQMRRDAVAMRVQALAAQAEPHFLFNTLANLRRQYMIDEAAGDRLIGHLLTYLEASLPAMRAGRGTLAQELRLIEAYLAVQQVRMGPRLHVALDVPPALAHAEVPPLVLLTLVENAIKHGLDPQPQGGSVEVRARASDDMLTLTVADTGAGVAPQNMGTGSGLANIRERLRLAHGERGHLALRLNQPHGLVAELRLPLAQEA